jgi:integrase
MVSHAIEKIQARGARETAGKVLQHVRSIFRFAAAKGLRNDNPAEPAIEILKRPDEVKHHPALLTFPELGDVLRRAEVAPITPALRLAHRLIAFTAVRIANAVAARWSEFHLDATPPKWIIPRQQMKQSRGRKHDHTVILHEQIAAELRRWRAAQSSTSGYVFLGTQGRDHLSREAVEKALRVTLKLANKHSPHGWRASFSTLAKENDFRKEVVDLALDHVHDSEVARAYDRGVRLTQRVDLMKWWGDSLVRAERGAEVVPLERAG